MPLDVAAAGDLAGESVSIIGGGALIACLSDNITIELVEAIAGLKEELHPKVMRVVLRDSGFVDDVAKTNAIRTLELAGIDDVHSI